MRNRIDLAHGAWIEYVASWLDAAEADRCLAALRDELAWEQREIVIFGRHVLQPRLIAWAGELHGDAHRANTDPVVDAGDVIESAADGTFEAAPGSAVTGTPRQRAGETGMS